MKQHIQIVRRIIRHTATAITAIGLAVAITLAASPAASGAVFTATRPLATVTSTLESTSTAFASCPTVTYKGVAYCAGTIVDLNAGAYPAGTRLALQPVAVLTKSGTTLGLGQVTATFGSTPCPPGMYCGAGSITCTETWQKSTSDFAKLNPRPVVGSAINVYGTVTTTRTLAPAAWALVGTSYQNNANFHPCWYL